MLCTKRSLLAQKWVLSINPFSWLCVCHSHFLFLKMLIDVKILEMRANKQLAFFSLAMRLHHFLPSCRKVLPLGTRTGTSVVGGRPSTSVPLIGSVRIWQLGRKVPVALHQPFWKPSLARPNTSVTASGLSQVMTEQRWWQLKQYLYSEASRQDKKTLFNVVQMAATATEQQLNI